MKHSLLLIPAFLALSPGCSKPEPPQVTIRVVTLSEGAGGIGFRDTVFWTASVGEAFEPNVPPMFRWTSIMGVLSIPDSSRAIVEIRNGLHREASVPRDRDTINVTSTPQPLYGGGPTTHGVVTLFVSVIIEGRPPEDYMLAPRRLRPPPIEVRVPIAGPTGSGTSTEP
jgi:hypothetical protein